MNIVRRQPIPDVGATTPVPALEPLLFELARPGRSGRHVRAEASADVPAAFARTAPLRLPELTEPQVVRHYTHLAQLNYSVDTGMYPLGSCTMKYNPKINDRAASLFADLHPRQSYQTTQGVLALAFELEQMLAKITGMDFVTLQPAAGAQSEFTALLMFKAYHAKRGDAAKRRRMIVPDSAHGTNPASAAMCGYEVTTVKSDARGNVDLCAAVHEAGGLVYGDGANMNALLGVARPGDLGFDCVHINVHKTFSTPHGAGGPGAGPLCVKERLRPFLPKPWIVRESDGRYHYDTAREDKDPETVGDSIGSVKQRLGNFGVLVRAYTYMKTLGEEGLVETGRDAVLAANYLLALLRDHYEVAYDRTPMHEFVLSAAKQKRQGANALDISKALLDEGFHSPTVYFPLIVPEALMIEPTETEPTETLDAFLEQFPTVDRQKAVAILELAKNRVITPAATG